MPHSPGDLPQVIVAPTQFVPVLLECLLGVMRDAAEGVEHCQYDLDAYPQALARFDRIRALLDATGWGEHRDIDLSEHSEALQDALSDRLATERGFLADADAMRENTGAAAQRERASEYASQIEAFMREAGLTIPEAGEQDA
jgi:hypothetical protein